MNLVSIRKVRKRTKNYPKKSEGKNSKEISELEKKTNKWNWLIQELTFWDRVS